MSDHHQSAKALIIAAAEKSGLLRETAKLLWFTEKYGGGDMCCTGGSCAPCNLLDRLVEEFAATAELAWMAAADTFSPACREAITITPRPEEAREVNTYVD
jgi:hypothetical protein